jgi:tetratricopeptide (TPR) repeat protein
LQNQLDRQLTDQELHRRVVGYSAEAGFYATGLSGLDAATIRTRLRARAEAALQLFNLKIEGSDRLTVKSDYLTDQQKTEIVEDCYELLLDLANAVAEPQPGQPREVHQRQAQEALRILDRASKLIGTSPAVEHWVRARFLAQSGDQPAADAARAQAGKAPLSRPFEYFLRGNDLYREGRYPQAVQHFEKALSKQPNHRGAQYVLAICYYKMRGFQKDVIRAHLNTARAVLTNCIDQQQKDENQNPVWPYLLRGYMLGELSEWDAAEADFRVVEAELEKHADEIARYGLFVYRGLVRVLRKEPDRAIADLTQAVRLRPGEYVAHVTLSEAYVQKKAWPEALRHLDRAIELNPPGAVAGLHRNRARVHELRHDPEAALQDLDQAIRHEPNGIHSVQVARDLTEKGRILVQSKRFKEAVAPLDAALLIQPTQARAHELRAEALLHLNQFSPAIQSLDRYLERDRDRHKSLAAVYLARAQAQKKVNNYAAAAEDYTRVLEFEPDNVAHLASRGWVYHVLEAPKLALRDFERVLELDPENGDAYAGRGYARVKLGQYQRAVTDAEAALRRGPKTTHSVYKTVRIFAQAIGQVDADKAVSPALSRQLRSRYQDRALALLEQALELNRSEADRAAFWTQTIQADGALDPIRSTTAYRQLAARFAPQPGRSGGPK